MKRLLFATLPLVTLTLCSCTSQRAGWGPGGAGSGGYNQDQLDFQSLPSRDESYSLYGPGSENVQRNPVAPVYFDFDSADVRPSEMPKIQRLSEIAQQTTVIIAGHTDATGTLEYNRALGERRALAVRKELLRLGVNPGAIQTISYGEEMLTNQGDNYDRRAEFGAVRR